MEGNKMKRKLMGLAVLLAALLCLAACQQAPQDGAETSEAALTVTKSDGAEVKVTMDTLGAMEAVEFTTEQGTSKTGAEKNTHRGVLLSDLLGEIGVDTAGIKELQVSSTDGFKAVYSKAQLDDPEKLYLTWAMDGEVLADQQGNDVFYIVARNEEFKQNWTKYVETIEVR
jgi:hypothetical protein